MNKRFCSLLILTVLAYSVLVAKEIPASDSLRLPVIYKESGITVAPPIEADSAVSMVEALQLVLSRHPSVLVAQSKFAAALGRLKQSGYRSNPEFSAEVEDFGRSEKTSPAQTTIGIEQPLDLFGKRGARRRIAEAELSAESLGVQQAYLDLFGAVAVTFAAALGTQAKVDLALQRLELANKIESAVLAKVTDGAVPKAELFRAQTATKLGEIDLESARSEAMQGRLVLATLWGSSDTGFQVDGVLDRWLTMPPVSAPAPLDDANPELAGLQSQVRAREAEIRLAQVVGKPDISLGAGYRRLHDDASNSFLVWAAVPLPLFDRNRGGIAEAIARLNQAKAELAMARQRLEGEIRQRLAIVEAQRKQIRLLREQVIPPAQQAMEEMDLAYRLGSQPYMNVLDAQRTLFELQEMLIDALTKGAQATAEIEQLTGHRLNPVGR